MINNSNAQYEVQNITGDIDITFEDVINFWMTLFPEIKSVSELEELLAKSSGTELKDLEKCYFNNNEANKIQDIFTFNESQIPNFNNTLDEIQKIYQWTYFFKPVICQYTGDLYEFIQKSNILENKDEIFSQSVLSVVGNLYTISYKVLVLETNIARMEGRLIGETSKEKAQYFINVLLKDESYLRKIYTEYPELIRLLDLSAKNTFSYIKEIITNTYKEIKSLDKKFNEGKGIGKISRIQLGDGDTHNNGKTVATIVFSTGIKVAYKPRTLDLESKFSDFVNWINAQYIPQFKPLKSCKIHTIDGAGWMEFVFHEECDNEQQVADFYKRTGQLLTILYILNAKDFHYENLIAQGEYPILIDLETLLHPEMLIGDSEDTSAEAKAFKIINDSVKSVALLPTQVINHKNEKVLDVGGLCGETEQEAPFKSVIIKNPDTDEIKIEEYFGTIQPKENNPSIKGTKISSEKFVTEIKDGFTVAYKWILENKQAFAKKITELFKDCMCRVIIRPTNVYCQLLNTSYHPDLLRNSTDRYVYLHRIGLTGNAYEIMPSELTDMINGDIPYFTMPVSKNTIQNGRKEELQYLYKNSTLDIILNKIEQISQKDLVRQIAFINLSYMDKLKKGLKSSTNISFQEQSAKITIDKELLINTSKSIGDYILDRSIVGEYKGSVDRTWIGTIEIANMLSFVTAVGNDIYNGNSGIALYLAYLGAVTGEEKYSKAALESIEPVIKYLDKISNITHEKIGGFSGICGWFYALFHIGHLLNNKKLIDYVKDNIKIIKNFAGITQNHDIISGYSGALGALLSIHDKTDDESFKHILIDICLDIYKAINDNIIVLHEKNCITWGKEGYVGYSHGNCGVEPQLMRLYNIVGNIDILDTIKKSILYSRCMFDKERKNWKKELSKDDFCYGWCHGAPGILLSRLMLLQAGYRDEEIMQEIQDAIETTKKHSFGIDYSLCHGDIGNLLILKYAAKVLKDDKLGLQCIATLNEFLYKYFSNNWGTAEFTETENSCLMVGPAGIGYGLLQFYDADLMPNILTFE